MIKSFGNPATSDLYHGYRSREAFSIPQTIWKAALRKLDMLNFAVELRDLSSPPGNRLEKLSGRFEGCHSIRINDQFRIAFQFHDGHAYEVQILDYH